MAIGVPELHIGRDTGFGPLVVFPVWTGVRRPLGWSRDGRARVRQLPLVAGQRGVIAGVAGPPVSARAVPVKIRAEAQPGGTALSVTTGRIAVSRVGRARRWAHLTALDRHHLLLEIA
jgi:hypothetical protein